MADILGIARHIQEQGEIGRARGTEQRLNRLTGQAVAAIDPQARNQFLQQAVATDPRAGFALQDRFQSQDDTRVKKAAGAAQYVLNAMKSGNQNAVNGAYMTVRPFLEELGRAEGKVPPPAWSPDMEPMLHQVIAASEGASAGAGGNVLSTYVDGQGNRVAVMRDGSTNVLGTADRGMSQQTISVEGPDGRPQQFTFDKRSGNYVPAALAGAPQAGPTSAGPIIRERDGRIVNLSDDLSPEDRAAIMRNPDAFAAVPDGGSIEAPAIDRSSYRSGGFQTPPAYSAQLVGQSPAEKAGSEALARRNVELATLPQELALRTQAEIQKAGGVEAARIGAQRQAEKSSALPELVATADSTIDLLDRLLKHPGRANATGLSSWNPLNLVPGTDAYDFNVMLDQVKGQAFLQAFSSLMGGGAITEREGQTATRAVARLNAAQSEQEFVTALADLKRIVSEGRMRAIQSAGQRAPAAPQSSARPQPSASDYSRLWGN